MSAVCFWWSGQDGPGPVGRVIAHGVAAFHGVTRRSVEASYTRSCEHCLHDRHGRPRLRGSGFHYSVSRSGPVTVVAISRAPVGIDVERLEPAALETDSWRHRRLLAESQVGPQPPSPTQVWVRKEAVLKAVGLGLAYPLEQVAVPGPAPARGITLVGGDLVVGWTDVGVRSGLAVALAVRGSGYAPEPLVSALEAPLIEGDVIDGLRRLVAASS